MKNKKSLRHLAGLLPVLICSFSLTYSQSFFNNTPVGMLQEKVTLTTDREIYCVGEYLLFKAFNLSDNKLKHADWSKVLYVEIITPESQPVFQGKFKYDTAGSSGMIMIPDDILTGNYYLRAYTKWMRNFSAYSYFYKVIKIINPFNRELLKAQPESAYIRADSSADYSGHGAFSVKTDKQIYRAGEKVILTTTMTKNRHQCKFFCISVIKSGTEKQVTFSIPEHDISGFHSDYIPETRSISLTGKVLNQTDSTPVPYLHVSLSVISKTKNILTTLTDNNGCFYFSIPEQNGEVELFISLKSSDSEMEPVIFVDNDFCTKEVKLPFIPFIHDENEEALFNDLIFNSQIAGKYKSRPSPEKSPDSVPAVPFYGLSVHAIPFSKFIPLPTIEDYFDEFLPNVVIRKKGKTKYFKVLGPYAELSIYEPLVLVDYVAVYNVDWILSINPKKVDRIEVIEKPYILGDLCYGGLIHIISVDRDFAGVNLPTSGRFFNYTMYTPADIYSCSRTENNRMPDVRNTLYWNPGVQLKEGKSENFTFYTADTPGEYIAIIESIDEKGKEIRDFCTFMVK